MKMYKVRYTFIIGGSTTVEHMTNTAGLIKLLQSAEANEITLHWIQVRS